MFSGEKILITGGAGTLGREFIRRAVKNEWNCHITIFSRDIFKHHAVKRAYPQVHSIVGDIRDSVTIYNAMAGKDIVIHAAATKVIPDGELHSIDTFEVNVEGSLNVLQAAAYHATPNLIGISTDKACLEWHSPVMLDDGRTIEIGALVKDKKDSKVLSYINGPSGDYIGAKKVSNWFKNKTDGRDMYSVSYENAPFHAGTRLHVLVTEDHEFLTIKDGQQNWVKARDLSTFGGKLITSEWKFNQLQEALLVGTVLGDSSISMNNGKNTRPRVRLVNSKDQEEWLRLKAKALGIEDVMVRESKQKHPRQNVINASSRTSASLFYYHKEFYPNGRKKVVPRELVVKNLKNDTTRDILLASWYLDDGCTTDGLARIATHGFEYDDVSWLSETLTKFGYESYVYTTHGEKRDYYELRFTKSGSVALYESISPAVPYSMKHKIPKIHFFTYKDVLWELGTTIFYKANPIVELIGKNKTGDVYCIDVEESHNFIVNNMILHNCHPANAYGSTKHLMEKAFQEFSRYGYPTRFGLVRYGNVLESNGSVIEAWKRSLAAGKPIKITDPSMTRFWISPKQAVQIIIDSILANVPSGHILIPKMKSLSIGKLAEYTVGKDCETEYIPLRPGEKYHETLLTAEECYYARSTEDYFILQPTTAGLVETPIFETYTSDKAQELTRDELMELLENE